jgi:1,4-dihydroxy-2-naphthoate octaprenyltransferase
MLKLTRAHIGIVVLPSFWLGSLFAMLLGYEFNLPIFLFGFLIIFLIYAAASYINDYYDFEADQYNRQFGFSGGSGVLQKYPNLKNITKFSALAFIIISLFLTFILSWITYIPVWSIGIILIGAFFSWFYSAPPIRFSYRGMSEFPHFIAGIMNTLWGYLIISGKIDVSVIIFSIPLSLHLLNVILIFEIPDLEADIQGGKKNIIVKKGRQTSFLLICLIFWLASAIYLILALVDWYGELINFWIVTFLSFIPSIFSTYIAFKKPTEASKATRFAIRTAMSLFISTMTILIYFIFLQIQ